MCHESELSCPDAQRVGRAGADLLLNTSDEALRNLPGFLDFRHRQCFQISSLQVRSINTWFGVRSTRDQTWNLPSRKCHGGTVEESLRNVPRRPKQPVHHHHVTDYVRGVEWRSLGL